MEKLVVIGSGMAGGKLIEELSLYDAEKKYDITVIGKEPYGNYDRIRLASLLKEDELDNFWFNSKEWYDKNNVKALLGQKAIKIDRKNSSVLTDKGNLVTYDKLVIATGSDPIVPPIEGADKVGIMTLRNLNDVNDIKKRLENKSRVIVVGGGVLGLELAYALREIGKEVIVSHLVDNLMEQQLNKDASKYLEELFKKSGIAFVKNTYITKLTSIENEEIKADFKDGQSIVTEAVIINCGIKPKKELAEESGIEIKKGIVVNNKLQTNDENIFAIGECIEYEGQSFGVIAPIFEQARTLVKILNGEDAVYKNSPIPPVKLKSDIAAITMGKIEEDSNDTVVSYINPITSIYKKLIINDNKLVGAHLVGEDLNSDALGVYYTAGLPLPNRIEQLIFPGVHKKGASSLAVYWPDDITICDCNGISCGKVRDAIRTHNDDLDRIVKETRAGTSCGTCKNRIQSIIDNTYDVIVIGAGLGGLSTAATMAKNGKKVLIIEKHDKVGGYATAFTREGYKFDVSLHNIGPLNSSLKKIFDDLEIIKKVDYVPYNNFQRVIFPEHDFTIPAGDNKFVEELVKLFPHEENGIRELFKEIKITRQGFEEFEELSLTGDPEKMINPMMAVKYPQFVEFVDKTLDEIVDSYVKDEKLKGLIGNFWWYVGLPPEKTASLIYFVTFINYFENAGGYIKGTSQELSDAFADIVKGNGGRVILETEVKKILIADGKAEGVLTDQGEIFYADLVISNANAVDTFVGLTDEDQIKKRIRRKVSNLEYSLSAIQLYLGLDCDPAEFGMKDHSFAVFYDYDHEKNYQWILEGNYENTFFSCTNYTMIDKDSTPEGKGIITLIGLDHIKNWSDLSEYEYNKKKDEVTNIFIKKAEKYMPGLSKHIVVKELGTPKTMQRYTFNPEGSIYGPSHITDQSGMRRLPSYTSTKGLFIVGSTIYPGGGYPSVIGSGYKTAKMILFAENNPRNDSQEEEE